MRTSRSSGSGWSSLSRPLAATLAAGLAVGLAVVPSVAYAGGGLDARDRPTLDRVTAADRASGRLTNLAHLNFLGARVTPPAQARHTTYRLSEGPKVGALWTYADHHDDGSFTRTGGGTYDPVNDTYAQGAFNADDMARAAVVYLRDWRQTGHASSRRGATAMLRGLTYLQTVSGPDRGNVVLWMQPDGTLNPSAIPVEQPDPSDSDASYWLARTTWALGEGYAAFKRTDPRFARFLRSRMELAVGALDREVLTRYGTFMDVDGRRTPRWLVADSADATGEAVLGLASYVRAGGSPAARQALRRFSDGVAAMSAGTARSWPFGAVLPSALSRSTWHAWSSQMPAALARAARTLRAPRLLDVAKRDSFSFDPWLILSGGPDNGRLPATADATQIAYGVDSRVESLMATGGPGAERLAGIVATWFFGRNAALRPAYDPTTGVTVDGVAADGTVNQNSGAESTIHGLLTMLALDAHPVAARLARTYLVDDYEGLRTLQAEDATLGAGATAVRPDGLSTAESSYSGTGYASLPDGGTATFGLGRVHDASLVMPVEDLVPGSTAETTWWDDSTAPPGHLLGTVRTGAVGAQGASPVPGALLPVTLPGTVGTDVPTVTARSASTGGDVTRVDALLVQPLLSRLTLDGRGHGTVLLRNVGSRVEHREEVLGGDGPFDIWSYDGRGRLLGHRTSHARYAPVDVTPDGGIVIVTR